MKLFNGIYIGMVIQNNDPENMGRVKIYVPHVSSLIENSKDLKKKQNLAFNFVGTNNPDILNSIDDLKKVLPWAEYAGPIFGGNASGRFNRTSEQGTVSDSNAWENGKIVEGFRPAQNHTNHLAPQDAFNATQGHKNRFVNQYAHQYTPSNYSGLPRGLFSIPNVGAHVYMFFREGDVNYPVYFASVYSQSDIKKIYTVNQIPSGVVPVDYPNTYENNKHNLLKNNTEDYKTFRSKTVFNSNKHTIEFIDTDLREILKINHYSGSFKEFNNYSNIELATKNDQKLVLGDQFNTVKLNQSNYVGGHKESIVAGDTYITIGETDENVVQNILKLQKEIHEYKLLFDIQRAEYNSPLYFKPDASKYGNPNDMSKYQRIKGLTGSIAAIKYTNGFVQCPLCNARPYDPYDELYSQNNEFYQAQDMWLQAPEFINMSVPSLIKVEVSNSLLEWSEVKYDEVQSMLQEGMEICNIFESFPIDIADVPLSETSLVPFTVTANTTTIGEIKNYLIGYIMKGFSPPYRLYTEIGQEAPETCSLKLKHPNENDIGYYMGAICPVCNGTGYSPSTENGSFDLEPAKQKGGELEKLIIQSSVPLMELEKRLVGGDEIKTVSMNKVETIGLAINDMKSFRNDPIGKMKIDSAHVLPQGTVASFKPSPHLEYVDVADIPGGDYNLTIGNKWKVLVGAKGVNIKTFGPIDIYGTIINFTGEQINISSQNEVIIDGGERLSLRARKVSLLPVEHNSVVVEGQLNVTRNMVVQGGSMFEGEMGILHVTAPLEWQRTTADIWDTEPIVNVPGSVVIAGAAPVPCVFQIPNHYHMFANIPLTLLPSREGVRETMISKGINSRTSIAAPSPTQSAVTGGCSQQLFTTVSEKFASVARDFAIRDLKSYGDESTPENGNFEMFESSGARSCASNGEVTSITAKYNWQYKGGSKYHHGVIRVKGDINKDGKLEGEIEQAP